MSSHKKPTPNKNLARTDARSFVGFLTFLFAILLSQAVISAPGDLVIPRKEDGPNIEQTPASTFPHWIHRIRYRCDACHNELFEMQLGKTEISMELMLKKQSCATCHNGENAFDTGFSNCNRCHR